VVETFLNVGESYLWLDANDRVVIAGKALANYVGEGEYWKLCDSPAYCEVQLDNGKVRGGSTWSKLAIRGQPIGTFVLVWFSDPSVTAQWGQRQLQAEIVWRLVASALVGTLTSLLLVSIVTRRLSKLAADASSPTSADATAVDIPGPFDVQGDDEIARLATALNAMRARIESLVASLRERDRQRREWVAMFSHDLRTPLTALSACLDRAREKLVAGETTDGGGSVTEALVVAGCGPAAHTGGWALRTGPARCRREAPSRARTAW
jgi:signal transduction histidine kinase